MKKKFVILISFIMMFGIVVGSSSNAKSIKSFDDKNLLFKVVDTQKINSIIIEISNETGIDLDKYE